MQQAHLFLAIPSALVRTPICEAENIFVLCKTWQGWKIVQWILSNAHALACCYVIFCQIQAWFLSVGSGQIPFSEPVQKMLIFMNSMPRLLSYLLLLASMVILLLPPSLHNSLVHMAVYTFSGYSQGIWHLSHYSICSPLYPLGLDTFLYRDKVE